MTTAIITHSDGHHVNGLVAFPADIKIIAHENNKKEQEAALTAGGRGAPPADRLPKQVVTKNRETITIDGVTLELYHWAPAHTSGDLVVYLPAEKIVATGDIVVTNRADDNPNIHFEKNGSTEGWLTNVKGMIGLNRRIESEPAKSFAGRCTRHEDWLNGRNPNRCRSFHGRNTHGIVLSHKNFEPREFWRRTGTRLEADGFPVGTTGRSPARVLGQPYFEMVRPRRCAVLVLHEVVRSHVLAGVLQNLRDSIRFRFLRFPIKPNVRLLQALR